MENLENFLDENKIDDKQNNRIFKILKDDYIYFLATTHSFFKDKDFLKHFGFIYLLYFIGFFKFLITDALTLDDQARLLYSYTDFTLAHRYLSEILSYIFNMNYPKIFYISPLTQLIAIAFLSLASLALVKIVNKKISYWGLLASVAVGLSPFYLECMSFKFDSPYMALATSCTILPFLFVKRLSLFFIVSVIFLLCMWNLYQANNGIYIVLSMFITLNLILQKAGLKQILKFIFVSLLAFGVALLAYKFIIMPLGTAGGHTNSIIDNTQYSFDNIKSVANRYFYLMNLWIGEHIIKILFFLSFILFGIAKFLERKINPFSSIFFIIIFLETGLFATFGLLYIFSNLKFEPRIFCGIGIFASILLISATNIKLKILNPCIKIFVLIFAYNLILISTIYINAKVIQAQYADFRINHAYSFVENNFQDKNYNIQIHPTNLYSTHRSTRTTHNNNVGFHKSVINMIDYIPISGNSAGNLLDFFNGTHKSKNIMPIKCKPENQNPIKTINTKLNKFEVYENDCIMVTYKRIPQKFDFKFQKDMIRYKIPIFETNLMENLRLSVSKDMRKSDYDIYNVIFEFNQDIREFASENDILSLHIHIKDRKMVIDKKLDDFKKIGDKFYYIVGLVNANPNDIEKIYLGFYSGEGGFSQRFLLDLKEISKK